MRLLPTFSFLLQKIPAFFILLFGLFLLQPALAQQSDKLTRVKGVVIDKETKEPLPFVAIAFKGTSVGTTTDFDGKYEISSQWATETMEVSFLGYKTFSATVKLGERQVIDVALEPESLALQEVTVEAKRKRYRKKNNPAVELMRKVIANKDENGLSSYDYYELDKYEKVELDVNNITEKFKNRKAFKKFKFIFDLVDTSEINGKPYLPIFLQEINAKVYYSKEKDKKREYREAIKATALEGYLDEESVTTIMDYMYEEVDIYSGNTILMGNQFTMPLSAIAVDFYRFYIIDTIEYQGKQAIDMAFIPKIKGNFGFNGNMYIALDSSYQVLNVKMGIVDDINLNFVQDLYIEQEFEPGPNGKYVISKDKLIVDYNITKKGVGFFGKRTTKYSNHIFNQPREDEIYDVQELVIEKENAREVGDEYWKEERPLELTRTEAGTYEMIDTLQQVPAFRRALNVISFLSTGYVSVGKFDIGPINSFYSGNAVEGFRARFGGRTNTNFSDKWQFDSYLAYGFKDERFKGSFTATYSFNDDWEENPKHYMRAGFTRETKFPGLQFDFINEDNFFLAVGRRGVADRMLLYNSYKAEYFRETGANVSLTLSAERLQQFAVGRLHFDYSDANGVASLDDIRTTEYGVGLRWAPNAEYFQGKINRYPIFNEHPVFQLNYAGSVEDFLDSDYTYHKLSFGLFKRFYLSVLGYTNMELEAGKIFGEEIPYVLLHIPRANQTLLYQMRSFNMMNFLEFTSDEYVKLNLRHYFNGFIFNRIPLFKRLKLREVMTFKAIYGRLTDVNNPELNPGLIQFTNQVDEETGEFVLDENGNTVPETYILSNEPYIEGSIGVTNVFKVLRIDLVKRFNYLDNPNLPSMFGVKGLGLRARVWVEF